MLRYRLRNVAIGRMTPLNASDVIWLSGTGDEISVFLKSSEVRDKAVVLGHPKDAKRMLELHVAPRPDRNDPEESTRTRGPGDRLVAHAGEDYRPHQGDREGGEIEWHV